MRLGFIVMLAAIMIAATLPAQAQKSAADKGGQPLDRLESEIDRLGAPGDNKAPASAESSSKQIAELQESLLRLKKNLAEKSTAIQQLEDENEKLRQALRLRFGGGGNGLPPVPIPNRELLESVLKEPAPFAERKETAGPSSAPEEYTVVSEWGRSPEVAASLPGKVASLIGLAIAVPPGMEEDDLKQLGKDLRENYRAYDNINIEVFDEVESARRFANEGKSDTAHRVMSISRFKHSGRDTFVMYRDGRAVTVP